jgi:hypothetical protein
MTTGARTETGRRLERHLSQLDVWAFAFGIIVG